nr:small nuclear RNA activating complex (SNAPc), subunit SNAP [Tanacetum cinerariifolium]
MQSLYGHCLGYMTSTDFISHRLGGLYGLYCLHETQPFNPPFRIHLSPWQFKRLKELVIDAKKENVEVVPALVNTMLDRNLFLFGAVDLKEGSAEERVNELIDVQNARVQLANKRLFADIEIERYIHMDMGKEVDLESLKKMSIDYVMAKELAIKAPNNCWIVNLDSAKSDIPKIDWDVDKLAAQAGLLRMHHSSKNFPGYHPKLFADIEIERYIHMDMGKEVDLESLK